MEDRVNCAIYDITLDLSIHRCKLIEHEFPKKQPLKCAFARSCLVPFTKHTTHVSFDLLQLFCSKLKEALEKADNDFDEF